MTIVGFNFTSINAKRKKQIQGKISIQNNVKIDEIRESELSVGTSKQKTLVFDFTYRSDYSPDIGEIVLCGSLIYMAEPEKVSEIMKLWKKEKGKGIPEDIMAPVLNTVLNKCSITALELSKEINLPPQIQLPKVKVKE